MKSIQDIFYNIVKDKFLLALLTFSAGLFAGALILSQSQYQASLIQEASYLTESEIPQLFTEYQQIREVDITALSSKRFFVEFFATESNGNALHPYAYIVTMDEDRVIDIEAVNPVQENILMPTPQSYPADE